MDEDDERALLVLLHAISFFLTVNRQILGRRRQLPIGLLQQHNIPRGPYCNFGTDFLLTTLQNGNVDLRRDFRLSRRSFIKLTNILHVNKHHGWQTEVEVLLFLFWLACGCAYRVVTRSIGVPLVTVHDVVHRQLHAIVHHLPRFINFPKPEEYNEISEGFAGTPELNKAIGAIDGTHVRVIPPSQHKEDYHNRKNQYSMQLQAVCNHEGIFTDIFTGYPGSVHDARVYSNSPLYVTPEFPPEGYYILGDSAYPLSNSLLTPFKEPEALRPLNARFNYHHSKARNIIERAFGQLKTRWRIIFTKDIELRCSIAPHIITSCAALHNLCHASGDILEEDNIGDEDDGPDDIPAEEIGAVEGIDLRARMAQAISAPAAYPDHMVDHEYFMLHARDLHLDAPHDDEM